MKKIHNVDIYVNGELADIASQRSLNLRINNTFANPEKIETISTEYSFSFSLPPTENNNRIFGFANVLSKRGKFNKPYEVSIEVDNLKAFQGYLMIQSITRHEGYRCNIYVNRLNTVEDVFGDSLMSDLEKWGMEFNLSETINERNREVCEEDKVKDCFFPLVSYGMFQKKPKETGFYTPKTDIDRYTNMWMENFYPSMNLLKTVRRCFAHKGYEVDGDIFDDDNIKRIYMSTNLADGQDPQYNYGSPELGKVTVSTIWSNKHIYDTGTSQLATHTVQQLDEPIIRVGKDYETGQFYYNYNEFNLYNIWSDAPGVTDSHLTSENGRPTTYDSSLFMESFSSDNPYMWRDGGIVVPMDGWYKVELDVKYDINDSTNSDIKIDEYIAVQQSDRNRTKVTTHEVTLPKTWGAFFTEVQLVKNDLEHSTTKPIAPSEQLDDCFEASAKAYRYYSSCYPHEEKGSTKLPTSENPYPAGMTPPKTGMLQYDPWVNKDFIMGICSSNDCRYGAVIKNGKSWNSECVDFVQSRFNCQPYLGIPTKQNPGGRGVVRDMPQQTSDYMNNTLPNSVPSTQSQSQQIYHNTSGTYETDTFNITNSTLNFSSNTEAKGKIQAIVHLNKNDILQLKLLTRCLNNPDSTRSGDNDVKVNVEAKVTVEAFGTDEIPVTSDLMDWNTDIREEETLDTELNLVNFLNKEEKMSDFISNFIKEFNLSYEQNGNTISLNKQKISNVKRSVVDLSDRVSEGDIETERIDYPSSIAVKYSIDTEERGFYNSVPFDDLEKPNWTTYGDYGYDTIKILDDNQAQEQSVSLKTSYNWFQDFDYKLSTPDVTIPLAVIAKDEWLINGYKDEEMMKKDGYGMKRRYWFPSPIKYPSVVINNDQEQKVDIYSVMNERNGFQLSYHLPQQGKETILSKFFNIYYDADTNYVVFKAYITTQEYIDLKNGAYVRIDDDIYIVTEIKGFDPTGNNMTEIKAIKK